MISTSIERNPKHDTIFSKRLLGCLAQAQNGAWEGFLLLDPEIQHWVSSIHIHFLVANDGTTPISATIRVDMESCGEITSKEWKASRSQQLKNIAGKDFDTIRHTFMNATRTSVVKLINQRKKQLCKLLDECQLLLNKVR